MSFKVSIITPERALPEMDADHVTLFAEDGEVGIRTDHAPLVALLENGFAMVKKFGDYHYRAFAVRGGVAQMLNNHLKILTPSAVDVHAVDSGELAKRQAAAKTDADRAWLNTQLAVAKKFPPPAERA
jgi:ATP synthase F1 epsilon subunit